MLLLQVINVRFKLANPNPVVLLLKLIHPSLCSDAFVNFPKLLQTKLAVVLPQPNFPFSSCFHLKHAAPPRFAPHMEAPQHMKRSLICQESGDHSANAILICFNKRTVLIPKPAKALSSSAQTEVLTASSQSRMNSNSGTSSGTLSESPSGSCTADARLCSAVGHLTLEKESCIQAPLPAHVCCCICHLVHDEHTEADSCGLHFSAGCLSKMPR